MTHLATDDGKTKDIFYDDDRISWELAIAELKMAARKAELRKARAARKSAVDKAYSARKSEHSKARTMARRYADRLRTHAVISIQQAPSLAYGSKSAARVRADHIIARRNAYRHAIAA